MKKELKEQTNRIKSMMEQIDDVTHRAFSNVETKEQGDEYGDESKASLGGTWIVVEDNGSMYHALVTGDPREKSLAVVLDGEFNKLPYEEWDKIEAIVDDFKTQNYGDF